MVNPWNILLALRKRRCVRRTRWVRRWVRRGRLADHGVGRGVRVRRAELRALNDPAPPSVEDFDLQARVDELLRRDAT